MFIGTDPEFFIISKKTGLPVPAYLFFGDKHKKTSIPIESKAFRDGYAVELNTQPNYCRALLFSAIARAIAHIRNIIGPDNELVAQPVVKIDLKDIVAGPDDVKTFGCDPSLNAYEEGRPSVATISALEHEFRYAGGHMHFSHFRVEDERPGLWRPHYPEMVRCLDLYLGLPLVALFEDESAPMRRKFYGKAGEYRDQDYWKDRTTPPSPYESTALRYGLEYRTPSAEMWRHHVTASFAFGVGKEVLKKYVNHTLTIPNVETSLKVREAINTGKGAWELLSDVSVCNFYNRDTLEDFKKYIEQHGLLKSPAVFAGPESLVDYHQVGFGDIARKNNFRGPVARLA